MTYEPILSVSYKENEKEKLSLSGLVNGFQNKVAAVNDVEREYPQSHLRFTAQFIVSHDQGWQNI